MKDSNSFNGDVEALSDYFVKWHGEGKHEGLICKDGKFFSNFRDYGYQLSGDINGRDDCGSDYSMKYLSRLSDNICDKDIIHSIISYHVDLCWSKVYHIRLTESDKKVLEEFKLKQVECYRVGKYVNHINPKSIVLADNGFYSLKVSKSSVLYQDILTSFDTVILDKEYLSKVVFEGGTYESDFLIDLICIEAKKKNLRVNRNNVFRAQKDFYKLADYLAYSVE